jgi:diaminopimelate decarboxylase
LALKAVLVKRVAGQRWIVADGGINLVPDFLERREIRIANRTNAQPEEIVNIVGPAALGHDFVTLKKCLPKIKVGDYIILSNVGAYTLSRSTQFLYPRPAALLVRPSGKVVLIRQRETCEDVVRMDRL